MNHVTAGFHSNPGLNDAEGRVQPLGYAAYMSPGCVMRVSQGLLSRLAKEAEWLQAGGTLGTVTKPVVFR